MMKKQVLLVVFALGLSSTVFADNYSVRTSDGTSCNSSEDTGQKVSFGTNFDSQTQTGSFEARYTYQLGKKKQSKLNCKRLYDIALSRERIKLEKTQLELELLKVQIRQAQKQKTSNVETITVGDDW